MWAVATAIQTIDMAIFTLIVSADLQYFLYFSQWKWLWWLLCVLFSNHDQVILLAFNDNSALFAEFDVCESQHIPQRIFPALWTSPATHHWLREIMLFWAPRIPVPTIGQFNTSNFLMQWFYQRFFCWQAKLLVEIYDEETFVSHFSPD